MSKNVGQFFNGPYFQAFIHLLSVGVTQLNRKNGTCDVLDVFEPAKVQGTTCEAIQQNKYLLVCGKRVI